MNQALYLVAGLGKTGNSIAGYLHRKNLPFVVFDTRNKVEGLDEFKSRFPGVDVFLGEFPPELYDQVIEIITSPGISLDEPFIQQAKQRNIPVVGDIECLAREIKAPVVAITGTNGKSTVTTLVGEMAKAAGLKVAVAGNIGLPVLELLDSADEHDLWVLELSSFQLDLLYSLKPEASAILNVSPDHLDRHHTMAAYTEAKQRIYRQAKTIVHNYDDSQTYPADNVKSADSVLVGYGLNQPKQQNDWGIIQQDGRDYLAYGQQLILAVDQMLIKGRHNWQNALAASALATAIGIKIEAVTEILKSFAGLPHRCQWVRTLDGVDWINDSKGTNIGATISAIAGIGGSITGKIVLIAGGLGKGADFRELRSVVSEHVRAVALIGKDAEKIEAALSGLTDIARAETLEQAMNKARQYAQPGDVVLLSPACASLDMFRDFNQRGEEFTRLAEQL
ncbi:UDP-N-acetylmuramoyl-L-alanine--D-glutamate ligase [Legionella dresdenensis]|uniref:UDP-N-acetylmuramoylalanine--D-glutamate ligase n=1 Tax=Legionella dresdenensis TaxID=450200 RepID=A0ABV8CG81_9GAMM